MKRIRIRFPIAELALMKEAVNRFNKAHGYLDEIILNLFNDHQVLLIAPAESAMFVESYLHAFPVFSRNRIKQDLIKGLEVVLKNEPNNLPAAHSLRVLKELSF